jgi:hypothetical protein
LEDAGVKEVKQRLVGVLFYSVPQIHVQLFFQPREFLPRMIRMGKRRATGPDDFVAF